MNIKIGVGVGEKRDFSREGRGFKRVVEGETTKIHCIDDIFMYEIVTQQNMEYYKITLKENNTGRDDSVDTRPENGPLAPMKKASVSFCA